MSVTVLVVDDSGFFRKRVCEILESVSGIKVVGTAQNGKEGIELVKKLNPDVVTMDYEMPVMDGVTAVRIIMDECPTPILMFSSLSYEGARVTLDALEAGAVDFLPKNFEDISSNAQGLQRELQKRILAIAKPKREDATESGVTKVNVSSVTPVSRVQPVKKLVRPDDKRTPIKKIVASPKSRISGPGKPTKISHPIDLVVIGASTGGPVALQKVLMNLPADFPAPILIVQHMPATFTPAFAERLNGLCNIKVKHASDGDMLQKGVAILAPGAKQMILSRQGHKVSVLEGDERLTYKPSVDITFGSAAKSFPGGVLGVVLTGMGADGREGCRLLKQTGSTVYTQSESTCVIYGMPMAVDKGGYSDKSIPIDQITNHILGGIG